MEGTQAGFAATKYEGLLLMFEIVYQDDGVDFHNCDGVCDADHQMIEALGIVV